MDQPAVLAADMRSVSSGQTQLGPSHAVQERRLHVGEDRLLLGVPGAVRLVAGGASGAHQPRLQLVAPPHR